MQVIQTGGGGAGDLASSYIQNFIVRQLKERELRDDEDRQYITAHSATMQGMEPYERVKYMAQLAQNDPERFKRIFSVDPSTLNVEQGAKSKYDDALYGARTNDVTGKSTDQYAPIRQNALITDSKLDATVQNNMLDAGMNGIDAAKKDAAIANHRELSKNEQVQANDRDALRAIEKQRADSYAAAEAARAEQEKASGNLSNQKAETVVQERTPGSGREQYETRLEEAKKADPKVKYFEDRIGQAQALLNTLDTMYAKTNDEKVKAGREVAAQQLNKEKLNYAEYLRNRQTRLPQPTAVAPPAMAPAAPAAPAAPRRSAWVPGKGLVSK